MARRRTKSLIGLAVGAALGGIVAWDLNQREHAILKDFPILGHLRYMLESVGQGLRQYVVTDNDEERPFIWDHRRWAFRPESVVNVSAMSSGPPAGIRLAFADHVGMPFFVGSRAC